MASLAELKKDFSKLMNSGDLSHGYLLFGPGEKKSFVKELANYLETKEWKPAEKVLLDALFLEDTGKEIGIEEVRGLIHFLSTTPLASSRRLAVVDFSGGITLQAENAILKISEEPPKYSLIILLVDNPDALLATTISRFQRIYVSGKIQEPNSKFQIMVEQFLKSQNPERKEIIKEIIEDNRQMEGFVSAFLEELSRDTINNWKALKYILKRWTLIKQYNVNKKLQLESALMNLK